MTVNVGITISNLPQIRRAFALAPHIIAPRLQKAITRSILIIGRESRMNTPVDTGRLRASHREIFKPLYGEVSTHVNYDIFVHEGTRFMKARPYLRDAVEAESDTVNNIFEDELQQALNHIARMTK